MDAVRQWVYEPAVIDGKPRSIIFTVTVRFSLKDSKREVAVSNGAVGGVIAPKKYQTRTS